MIHGLILAAGASSRMGRPKALLVLDGETFLAGLVRRFKSAGCTTVTVVGGAHTDEIRRALPNHTQLVHAPLWTLGMRASLRAGLFECPPGTILLTHVDRPRVHIATLRALMCSSGMVIPTFEGQGGHPVRLPASLRARLCQTDDTPLCDLLHNATRLPVNDPDILLNVNTPEDLQVLRKRSVQPRQS